MDEDEEMWFNTDDEVDDINTNVTDSLNYKLETKFDQFNKKIADRKSTLGIYTFH